MNNFEYLRYMNIGQYLPTGSILHRLDPRARILAALFLLATVTFTTHLVGLALALLVVLLLLWIGRIPLLYALRGLVLPLPFLAILAVLQVLFPPYAVQSTPLVQLGFLRITTAGLLAALILLMRFATLVLTLELASFTISTSETVRGLESLLSPFTRIGLPTHDLVMTLQIMIRFLPFLTLTAERIAKAQASRGADWGTRNRNPLRQVRQVFPLLVPLFLTGLQRADSLALAMDARGYATRSRHTSMIELHFRPVDALALLLAAALAAVIFIT